MVNGQSLQPDRDATDLSLLRQFLRAALNDSFAGNELALALAYRLDMQQIAPSSTMRRAQAVLKEALRTWQMHQASSQDWELFGGDLPFHLQDLESERGHHVGILTDVFRFTVDDTADCLGIARDDVIRLRDEERAARAERQLEGIALIIEDDAIVASGVVDLVESVGFQVSDVSDTVDDAIAAAKRSPPSIVVSDYDLGAGGNGADAVAAIMDAYHCPVIFVTAYPDRVLTGMDFEPTFVLSKPYAPESLKAALYYAIRLTGFDAIDAEASDAS